MPADIILRDASAPADPDANLRLRWENLVGAPVTALVDLIDGHLVADVYLLEFTNSGSVTVTVTADQGTKSPYHDVSGSLLATAGATNYDILPGLAIDLDATINTGDQLRVSVGALMDAVGATQDRLNAGVVDAGLLSTERRVAATNVGAAQGRDTTVYALPGFHWTGADYEDTIAKVDNHTDPSRQELAVAGALVITFANWQDGTGADVGYKVADVLVGGATAIVQGRFDGTTVYQHGVAAYNDGTDLLQGLGIVLANTVSDPTSRSFTLTVVDGHELVELAPDVTGTAGTFAAPPLVITESGQSSGVVLAGGSAFFWFRYNVPTSEPPGDMRKVRFLVRTKSV